MTVVRVHYTTFLLNTAKDNWIPTDWSPLHLRLKVDIDGAAGNLVDEGEDTIGDGGPLDGKGRHQHVEGYATVTIATQEGH